MKTIIAKNVGKRFKLHHGGGLTTLKEFFRNLVSGHKKEFDDEFAALHDISFTLEKGQALGLIGHNGSGKSTLLKILARITEPTEGEILINGRMASLLEVGTGFHPDLTGRENVFLNGVILGLTRKQIADKFDEILAFSEIGEFIDTPVKHYSSGMYVKLAFAVATAIKPDILVVDEVLAVGDKAFQEKCIKYMQEFVKSGGTLLFVSHDPELVRRVCTDVAWLNKGALWGISSDIPGILSKMNQGCTNEEIC